MSPLDRLGDSVVKIDAEHLTERLPTQGIPVELEPLIDKTNELLERLSESFARERRFSSYAAHELRTPLAELKSMLQLGESWPDELSTEQIREMLNMVDDLELPTEKLTTLSRAESGILPSLSKEHHSRPAVSHPSSRLKCNFNSVVE
ncbi:MAG: hypothetical protein KDM63_00015 [Verrucomicrobiae bacterium]|nr:hypothetical protein [Verrucomicrobiae bacterium]MCB1085399.1 hypothetical protein [Verrucomicrobiae bacterium]